MEPSSVTKLTATEAKRWSTDRAVVVIVAAGAAAVAALTFLAVLVASGAMQSGSGGVQIQADTLLGAGSTDQDLASMLHSSLVLLLPIAAVVVGARFAGNEMSSGALLTLAAVARRLRLLFAVRVVVLAAALVVMAVLSSVLAAAAGTLALSSEEVQHLSAWRYLAPLTLGAVVQTLALGLLTFALSALTRRWVPIVIGVIVYVVAIEPVVQGIAGGDLTWLPRTATSALVAVAPDWGPALPTLAIICLLTGWAILSLRRDRAFR